MIIAINMTAQPKAPLKRGADEVSASRISPRIPTRGREVSTPRQARHILTEYLQRECSAAAHNACIQQRNSRADNRVHFRLLKYKHTDNRNNTRYEELSARERHIVDLLAEMVDNKYMHGERHGAHNGHYLALADGEIAFLMLRK